MDDFNVDLLHYETHSLTSEFSDKMFSTSLSPHIATPMRVTPRSKTLIDSIFTNGLDENSISGNLTCSISDHLAQFLVYTNKSMVSNFDQKEVLHRRNFKNMDKEKFKGNI